MNQKLNHGEILDRDGYAVIYVSYEDKAIAQFNSDWIPDDAKNWLSDILYDILKSSYHAGKRDEYERIKNSLSVIKELLK